MGYYRNIKTTQEHRMNLAVKDFNREHKYEGITVKIRFARMHKNLPNAWDDFHKPQYRSWKKYRAVQHR